MQKNIFFLIFGCFLFANCEKMPIATLAPTPTTDLLPVQRSYLALGDSYTIGQSVPDSARWSVLLNGLLANQKIRIVQHKIIARTGWTCNELQQQGIDVAADTTKYDLVSLLIGVNNQYRGQSIEAFRTEFRAVLQRALTFVKQGDKKRLVVLSIPDWGYSPFGSTRNQGQISASIDAFNAVEQAECNDLGVIFLNITTLTRVNPSDIGYFANDGLHYSAKMHRLWAEKTLPYTTQILR